MQVPSVDHNRKKHPCPDCTFCQWCSDDRCRLCRGGHGCRGRKLSLAEQIALYDEINRTSADPPAAEMTDDRIESLDLRIRQPRNGYRFSIDPLLLARFTPLSDDLRGVDLGTGCGVIPLVCARLNGTCRFVGIEKQSELAAAARENVRMNGLAHRVEIVEGDILQVRGRFPVSSFDIVTCNPPYRKPEMGRRSPHPGRDEARHESSAGLMDFLEVSKYLVKPSGSICFIHLAERLPEFLSAAHTLRLTVKRLRTVHGNIGAPARMILYELVKGRGARTEILPPLIIRDEDGSPTKETEWLGHR